MTRIVLLFAWVICCTQFAFSQTCKYSEVSSTRSALSDADAAYEIKTHQSSFQPAGTVGFYVSENNVVEFSDFKIKAIHE